MSRTCDNCTRIARGSMTLSLCESCARAVARILAAEQLERLRKGEMTSAEFKDKMLAAIAGGTFETKPSGYGSPNLKTAAAARLAIADLERLAGDVGVKFAKKQARLHLELRAQGKYHDKDAYRHALEWCIAQASKRSKKRA